MKIDINKNNLLVYTNVKSFDNKEVFDNKYNKVSKHRKEKINKEKSFLRKCESLATELLLDYGLNLLSINKYNIDYSFQKPKLIGSDICFNFSHSKGVVACAISKDEVGCDVERIDKANIKIAEKCFNNSEYLNIINNIEPNKTFYRYWTLKESFIKNIGCGLNIPLNEFEIILSDPISIKQKFNLKKYSFKELEVDENYSLAACTLNDMDFKIIEVDLANI